MKIVEELPEIRRDTVDLVKNVMRQKRKVYVSVKNPALPGGAF